jgi:hypothetical protein
MFAEWVLLSTSVTTTQSNSHSTPLISGYLDHLYYHTTLYITSEFLSYWQALGIRIWAFVIGSGIPFGGRKEYRRMKNDLDKYPRICFYWFSLFARLRHGSAPQIDLLD